jgi:Gti1/Pac2 family transcription factor
VDGPTRSAHSSSALLHQDRSGGNHTGLIKQAYSALVMLYPNSRPRKWHLTAYFTYSDLPSIPTIDRDPILSRITVPPGIYHGGKSKLKGDDEGLDSPPSSPISPGSSSAREYGGRPTALPSLQSTVGSYALHPRSVYPRAGPGRISSEDHRVIHMLNSRHVS